MTNTRYFSILVAAVLLSNGGGCLTMNRATIPSPYGTPFADDVYSASRPTVTVPVTNTEVRGQIPLPTYPPTYAGGSPQSLPTYPPTYASGSPQSPPTYPPTYAGGSPQSPPPPSEHWAPWANPPAPNPQKTADTAELERWEASRSAMLPEDGSATGIEEYLRPLPPYRGRFTQRILDHDAEKTSPFVQMSALEPYQPKPMEKIELEDWEKEDVRFDWTKLDPATFFRRIRDWMGMGPDEREANELVRKGREVLLTNPDLKDVNKNNEAAKLFERAAKKWPDSVLEEDALFFAGESRFFADEYTQAQTNYTSLIHKYHSTQHMNTAVRRLFSIARYWEKLDIEQSKMVNVTDHTRPTFDTFGNMKKCYEAIFVNDPRGPISDAAVMALAEAYMAKGLREGDSAFENAAFYYAYLRENYPTSKYIAQAHQRELEAQKMAYAGKFYDDKSLIKAGKLADQTLRHFATDTSIDREAVRELSEEITLQKAQREWAFGQFYDKKKEYGAAKTYYHRILELYPTTTFADQSQKRLEEIRDLPDEPNGFEQWINRVMPSKKGW